VTWLDLLGALAMLGSVLVVVALLLWMLGAALLGRWARARRLAVALGTYVAAYVVVLGATGLAMPRRTQAPGARRCFDDWCVAALSADEVGGAAWPCPAEPGSRQWVVTLEVSSVAKRVRQRALDAAAMLEDRDGRRSAPCAGSLTSHDLADAVDPGGSFRVVEPYRLPAGASPAGVVVRHGAFPGVMIIGDDQSFLHRPTLMEVAAGR
jgi:hypothetical protein